MTQQRQKAPRVAAHRHRGDIRCRRHQRVARVAQRLKLLERLRTTKLLQRTTLEMARPELELPLTICSLRRLIWWHHHAPSVVWDPFDRIRRSDGVEHLLEWVVRWRGAAKDNGGAAVKCVRGAIRRLALECCTAACEVMRLQHGNTLAIALRQDSAAQRPPMPAPTTATSYSPLSSPATTVWHRGTEFRPQPVECR